MAIFTLNLVALFPSRRQAIPVTMFSLFIS
jgi:hypothetical protein